MLRWVVNMLLLAHHMEIIVTFRYNRLITYSLIRKKLYDPTIIVAP